MAFEMTPEVKEQMRAMLREQIDEMLDRSTWFEVSNERGFIPYSIDGLTMQHYPSGEHTLTLHWLGVEK